MEQRLSAVLSPYKGRGDALIPILQQVQEELGYLPDDAMMAIAKTTGLPESRSGRPGRARPGRPVRPPPVREGEPGRWLGGWSASGGAV